MNKSHLLSTIKAASQGTPAWAGGVTLLPVCLSTPGALLTVGTGLVPAGWPFIPLCYLALNSSCHHPLFCLGGCTCCSCLARPAWQRVWLGGPEHWFLAMAHPPASLSPSVFDLRLPRPLLAMIWALVVSQGGKVCGSKYYLSLFKADSSQMLAASICPAVHGNWRIHRFQVHQTKCSFVFRNQSLAKHAWVLVQ